ncbi:MAG: helical backbone metal receptor [Mariprofundus sp.]
MKALLLLFALLACTPANATERILALSPHACEILHAIGADDGVVGISEYCDYPASFKNKPVIADYSRVFVESALRLKPTMVVAPHAALKGLSQIKKHGVQIVITHPASLHDIFEDTERIGRLTGHAAQAHHLVQSLKQRLKKIQANIGSRKRAFFEVWGDPLMTEAGRSFITEVLSAAGADNVFAARNVETMRLNVEAVLRAKPEMIIIPSKSGRIDGRIAFWKQWLPDVPVIAVNPDMVSRPGPRIIDGIEALQRQLQRQQDRTP